jgi:omega-amidase
MENINITIIQSNLHWESIDKNLEMFSQKIASITEPTDLIVLPEMFNTGFTMSTKTVAEHMTGKTRQWMRQQCKEKKCAITGSLIISENGRYYNRLIWMWPDGSYKTYDKRHLFGMSEEDKYFTAGKKSIVVELKGWKLCPLICYDLRFPVWSRNNWSQESKLKKAKGTGLIAEYDVLLYVANWPERRAHPWKTLLMARAIENQCFVVGVNRVGNDGNNINHSGDSAIINFKGELLSKTKTNEEFIDTVSLNYSELEEFRKVFPVGLDADDFSIDS